MGPQRILRLEGLAVLIAALAAYFALDGSLILLAVLALVPDLSMLGYLRGPAVGAVVYNAVHAYVLPLVLAGSGLWLGEPLATRIGLIWLGHVGADRAFGYGLKHSSGFQETHLGRVGRSPGFAEE